MNKPPEGTHRNTTLPTLPHCDQCVLNHRDVIRGLVYCDSTAKTEQVEGLDGTPIMIASRIKGMKNPSKKIACIDFDADISMLELGDRAFWILHKMKIYTIQELRTKTANELLRDPELGNQSLDEIEAALAKIGFALIPDGPRPIIHQSKPGER